MSTKIFNTTLVLVLISFAAVNAQTKPNTVKTLKLTILSTMLTDFNGIGEWGFCALVEVDGKKILFDTGARPETVLNNIRELQIDLTDVTEVFISHNHQDHTGGLNSLKKVLSETNPNALSVAHIGDGAFYRRPRAMGDTTASYMISAQREFEKAGGKFIVYKETKEIYPGVWITGPVPRVHPERNWMGQGKMILPNGKVVEDIIPEDQSMIFNTVDGLVILSGCGHAGVVNTMEYARKQIGVPVVKTLIGGFHLFNLPDEKIRWTATKMKEFGVQNFIGAHCTGVNAVFDLRQQIGLGRNNAVVGAVGSSFELGKGISPGMIAK